MSKSKAEQKSERRKTKGPETCEKDLCCSFSPRSTGSLRRASPASLGEQIEALSVPVPAPETVSYHVHGGLHQVEIYGKRVQQGPDPFLRASALPVQREPTEDQVVSEAWMNQEEQENHARRFGRRSPSTDLASFQEKIRESTQAAVAMIRSGNKQKDRPEALEVRRAH